MPRAELKRMGTDVVTVICDIDVLINNAGTIAVGPMDTMTLEDYQGAMEIHFWAPLYVLTVAPEMRRRRQGRIVNIASIGGKMSVPHLPSYRASKFGSPKYCARS